MSFKRWSFRPCAVLFYMQTLSRLRQWQALKTLSREFAGYLANRQQGRDPAKAGNNLRSESGARTELVKGGRPDIYKKNPCHCPFI
jgi:hypothetical protein